MRSGVCLRVKWCFLRGRAGNISISCRHSRLSHVQLRLWRWRCLLGVVNSCGLLGALVLCCGRHTSSPRPDIRLNTNSCSSHPRQVTVVRSSHVYGCMSYIHVHIRIRCHVTELKLHSVTAGQTLHDYNFIMWSRLTDLINIMMVISRVAAKLRII